MISNVDYPPHSGSNVCRTLPFFAFSILFCARSIRILVTLALGGAGVSLYFVLRQCSDSGKEEGKYRPKAEDSRDGGDEEQKGDEEDGMPGEEERVSPRVDIMLVQEFSSSPSSA